jgi:hypothetical protein
MASIMKEGFPTELITPDMSVLCLFSAAFIGFNDVQFIHQAGCRNVTLVDIDRIKLDETGKMFNYPVICEDILQALDDCKCYGKFDVVISDQPNGDCEKQIHTKHLYKLLNMTRKILILSCSQQNIAGGRPFGEYYQRNANYLGGIYWRVITL